MSMELLLSARAIKSASALSKVHTDGISHRNHQNHRSVFGIVMSMELLLSARAMMSASALSKIQKRSVVL
jgi:hypothetical protein